MYKRILVPVGYHLQSDLPVEYAVALAAFTGAELWGAFGDSYTPQGPSL